ncbi:MAG: transglutaminase family protein [Acidobacteria bacterium]|nr:transglutaminase family protein [Acidobacteriota bacterium]
MRDITDLLTRRRSAATLDHAALDIAALQYPGLDPAPWIAVLDSLASAVNALAGPSAPGRDFVHAANSVLFGDFGLLGNARDYYDIRNSCLNDVLHRRLGIPITLSVVYLEIARRLGRSLYGIALPAHFIVQYDDGRFDSYIDPFHGGQLLTRDECVNLVVERTGAPPPASSFLPCGPKQIALRMLQNMKSIYVRTEEWQKSLNVFDLLIQGSSAPGERKHRAVVLIGMRRYRDAIADLRAYLKADPQASDRAEVVEQIENLQRYLAALN